ncbi:MAG TPA: hypothetical protein VGL36_35380 [Kribbella sp.]
MSDDRPMMLGYFRETFLMTPGERERTRQQLLDFADSQGYRMTAIFTEGLDTQPAALKALLEAAHRDAVAAVAFSGPEALAQLHRRDLEDAGIRVLIAGGPPP